MIFSEKKYITKQVLITVHLECKIKRFIFNHIFRKIFDKTSLSYCSFTVEEKKIEIIFKTFRIS